MAAPQPLPSLSNLTNRVLTVLPAPALAVAAWSIVFISVVYALYWVGIIASHIMLVIIPLALAIMLALMLNPLVDWLDDRSGRFPRALIAVLVVSLFFGLAIVAMSFVVTELIGAGKHFQGFIEQSVDILSATLANSPIKFDVSAIDQLQDQMVGWVRQHWREITNNAYAVGSNVAIVATGSMLLFFGLIYFLNDGKKVWRWVVRLLPEAFEEPTYQAFRRGAKSLSAYVNAMVLVATFDATLIGSGAFFLGVPLVLPIILMTFIGAFIPLVGPVLTGAIAVLVALAAKGPSVAITLAIIVLVTQQIDGNILQPLLLGNAVSLHPLAVLIAITIGSGVFGFAGMVFAVPVVALTNTVMRYYLGNDPFPELGQSQTLNNPEASN